MFKIANLSPIVYGHMIYSVQVTMLEAASFHTPMWSMEKLGEGVSSFVKFCIPMHARYIYFYPLALQPVRCMKKKNFGHHVANINRSSRLCESIFYSMPLTCDLFVVKHDKTWGSFRLQVKLLAIW